VKREITSDGRRPNFHKNLSNIIITLFPNKYGIIRKDGKARKHAKTPAELGGIK